MESNNVIFDGDDELIYVTDEDIPCNSDDENFEGDSSQKNLFQERSINALINDVNAIITPGGPNDPKYKLESNRSGRSTERRNKFGG